jgi:hypothetical protein
MSTVPPDATESLAFNPRFAIGLTMSGGGYRAAAYHLGTLSYLERLELLPHLEAISTVSGGTFTGTRYLLSLVEGESFREYFGSFYEFLQTTDLLELAVRKLGPERYSNNLPRQLAIDAFAQVYADTLLKKKDGSTFLMKDIFEVQSPLTDVVFNSTEFRHGIGFRFQKSEFPSKFGNRYVFVPDEISGNLRVADILAASSCFPGGFEPIAWPQSFHLEAPTLPTDKQLPMMDGGVYDNQGIESLLLADRRSKETAKEGSTSILEMTESPLRFQMLIISDTDRLDDEIYSFPPPAPSTLLGMLSLGTLWWAFWGVIVLCLITLWGNGMELVRVLGTPELRTPIRLISHFTSLGLALMVVFVGLSMWNLIYRKLAPLIPHWDRLRHDLKHLLLSQAIEMVQLRISSLFALANDVFMKRIRGLLYTQVYESDSLRKTAVASLIYKLRKYATRKSFAEKERFADTHSPAWPFPQHPEIAIPSELLLAVVDDSVKMPTTLWFDDNVMLPKLVATGHATLCFQLLNHLNYTYGPDITKFPPEIRKYWDSLIEDWQKFQTDPYFALRAMLPAEMQRSVPPIESR